MGLAIEYTDGQTPLSEEEKDGLKIPSITTREEFEELNIEKAYGVLTFHKSYYCNQIIG